MRASAVIDGAYEFGAFDSGAAENASPCSLAKEKRRLTRGKKPPTKWFFREGLSAQRGVFGEHGSANDRPALR